MNLQNLILQRARPDGRAAFWLTRGNEYAVVAGKADAIGAKIILQGLRYIDLGSGACKLAYVESGHTVAPSTFQGLPQQPGGPLQNLMLRALLISESGQITQTAVNDDGSITEYVGQVREEAAFDGQVNVTQSIKITFLKDKVMGESFQTEFTTMPRGPAEGAFLPCDINVTVARTSDPRLKGVGPGVVIASNYGRKYATADLMRAELGDAAAQFTAFFDQWPLLMK